MHIVISNLEKYLNSEGEIVTLHPFVANSLKASDQKRIKIDTIKAFDNPEEISQSYEYIYDLVSEVSTIIGEKLNIIHKKNYKSEYWKVMLGIWLLNYISMLYDRYTRIKKVIKSIKEPTITNTDRDFSQYEFINGIQFFETASIDKEFNQFIYVQISKHLNIKVINNNKRNNVLERSLILNKVSSDINVPGKHMGNPIFTKIKNIFKYVYSFIKKVEEKIFSNRSEIIFYHSYLPLKSSFLLSIMSFYKIYELNLRRMKSYNFKKSIKNNNDRSYISKYDKDNDEFKNLVFKMMPLCIPKSFIENYKDIINYSNQAYKNLKPKIIFSPNAWSYDYAFIHWAMNCKFEGSKIVSGTHANGGPACLKRYKILVDFEKSLANYYIDAGRYYLNDNKIKNLTSGILLKSRGRARRPKDQILYVGTADPLYPIGVLEDFNSYINNTMQILRALPKEIQSKILFRSHYEDTGWGLNEKISRNFPGMKYSMWNKKFHDEIFSSKLCIYGYISTTCHESLALNIPSIIFLDKGQYLLNEECKEDFESLKNVGILHDDPIKLANWLKLNYYQIDKWWYSRECQRTINQFNFKYMHIEKKPYKEWKNVFQSILNDS